ncbi:hypothetical protein GGQ00_003019 [Salinibacter ruber]|nr:hypothetical protein [Salinibacter ruber]
MSRYTFPYDYECSGCSRAATVTHEGVQDATSCFTTSTVAEAAEYVMLRRQGWSLKSMEGMPGLRR